MSIEQLKYAAEAILFASGEAVDIKDIASALEQDVKTMHSIMAELMDDYENRGIHIIQIDTSYQMCTRSEYFDSIKKLYQAPRRKVLSTTLLETLAIIAYRQPVTKAQIEEIRGVSADHAVNKLVEYGLVDEAGRLDAPGKPILFGTTDEFLRYFGFKTVEAMPELPEVGEQLRMEIQQELNFMGDTD
ncbi:MAG: SMC-Scp complex subunit ScpB [Firmicutes bacterium]|nr:SMC-Scp complex subunit ScpB [Bacillota bacterium]